MTPAKTTQEMTTAGPNIMAGERHRQRRRRPELDGAAIVGDATDVAATRHYEIMSALQKLTTLLSQSVVASADRSPPVSESLTIAADTAAPSPHMRAMADADEGASWKYAGLVAEEAVRVGRVSLTQEIDSIITAAEAATEAVIANAELIDDLIGRFGKRIGFIDNDAHLDDAGVCLVRIFEACSRQDVACQHLRRLLDEITAPDF